MKLFGLFSAVFCNILLISLLNYFSPDVDDFSFLEDIYVSVYISFVALFYWYLLTFKKINIYINNILFLLFIVTSFIYIHTILYLSIKIEDYESMSEWNAARGLSAIFFVPFVFIISLVKGLGYDFLMNKRLKNDRISE